MIMKSMLLIKGVSSSCPGPFNTLWQIRVNALYVQNGAKAESRDVSEMG